MRRADVAGRTPRLSLGGVKAAAAPYVKSGAFSGIPECNLRALSALGYLAAVRQDARIPGRGFAIETIGGERHAAQIAGTAGV